MFQGCICARTRKVQLITVRAVACQFQHWAEDQIGAYTSVPPANAQFFCILLVVNVPGLLSSIG